MGREISCLNYLKKWVNDITLRDTNIIIKKKGWIDKDMIYFEASVNVKQSMSPQKGVS